MKSKHYKSGGKLVIFITFFILALQSAFAQNKSSDNSGSFSILVERVAGGIQLYSFGGCAWTDLSLSFKQYESVAIDQYGMTSIDKEPESADSSLARFHIIIRKTKTGYAFESKEGTAWKTLSVGCGNGDCLHYIDFYGSHKKKPTIK